MPLQLQQRRRIHVMSTPRERAYHLYAEANSSLYGDSGKPGLRPWLRRQMDYNNGCARYISAEMYYHLLYMTRLVNYQGYL